VLPSTRLSEMSCQFRVPPRLAKLLEALRQHQSGPFEFTYGQESVSWCDHHGRVCYGCEHQKAST
jgi:hypothetical protein